MLIGYQLLRVAGPAITLPVPPSVTNSAADAVPSPLRSACICSIKIAFGCTGFAAPFAGGFTPRAKPSSSHSFVTAVYTPPPFRYSTRKYPSSKFHG